MARESFRLRRYTGAGDVTGVGSYIRGTDALQITAGASVTDVDAAIRSTGIIETLPSSVSTTAVDENESVFEAQAIEYNAVVLNWSLTDEFTIESSVANGATGLINVALVYSDSGFPQTVVDGQLLFSGVVDTYLHQETVTITTDVGPLSVQKPTSGKWAYYTLFAYYYVKDSASYFYERLASLEILVPKDYGSKDDMWKRVPKYYRDADRGNTQLERFIDTFGFELDRSRTLIDSIMTQHDPLLAEAEGVEQLANMLGLELNVNDIGVSRTRALLHDIGYLRRSKGTLDSVRDYITAVSGSDVTITTGASAPFYTFNVHAQRANLVADPRFLTNSGVSWNVAQQPAVTRTNLIPNPSFETNTTGWGGSNVTVAQSATFAYSGVNSLRGTTVGTGTDRYIDKSFVTVTGNTAHSYSCWAYLPATNTADTSWALQVYEWNGTTYTVLNSLQTTTITRGVWTKFSGSFTTAATTIAVQIRFIHASSIAVGQVVYLDGALLETGATVRPYFDGTYVDDYQGYGILSKGWSGTANASTSTASWFTGNTRTNLITNPNFEVDTTGWAGLGGATLSRSTANAFIGTASMLITDTSTGSAGASTTFTPVSGTSYTFSFYVRNIGGLSRNMYAQIGWTGGTFSTSNIISVSVGMNNWLRISVTGTAPNSSTANIYIVTSDGANTETTESALVDGILLEAGSVLLPYFDGAFTAKRQNLIPNPSFETNTTGWNANGSTNTRVAGTWGSGSWAYQVVATGTGLSGTFSDFASFPVTEGQAYTASGYVKSISGTLRQVQIGLNWYNGAGTSISASTTNSTLTTSSQRISVTATAPVGAVHALISVYGLGTGTVGDTWQLDSVLVEAGSALRSYFDGTSTEQDYNGFTLNTQAWSGTANASTSTTSWYTTNLLPTISTTPTEGIQITAGASGNKIAVVSNVAVPVSANNSYYISADFSSLPQIVYGGSWATSSTWTDWSDNTAAGSISVGVAGRYAYEMNATTSGTKYPAFLLNLSAGQSITLSKWMVEPNSAGQFFDGDTVFSGFLYQGFTSDHTWSGTKYASYSLYTTNRKKTQDALSRLMPKILPVTLMGTSGGNAKYLMQFDWIPGKT